MKKKKYSNCIKYVFLSNNLMYKAHWSKLYQQRFYLDVFPISMVATSATDLSGNLGRLLDRNLLTVLNGDLLAALFWDLLTALNRFLNWHLMK